MQTEMNKLFAEGGIMQQGGTVDPVSGNDVPPGAMAEEVRDDIDAKLSEGEFVFPADVVRYVGLDTLMKIRDKAKAGLKRMNEIGQMGNAEEVPDAEALHGGKDEMDDEAFSSEIDSIMSEDGGQEYAAGGDVRKYDAGGYVGGTANQQLYRDAPIRGFEMVEMVNKEGQTIYIPFINGRPQLSIPQGYTVKSSDVTTTTPTTPVTGTGTPTPQPTDGAGGVGDGAPAAPSSPGFTIGEDGFATPNETSPTIGSALGGFVGTMAGLPPALTSQIGKSIVSQSNFENSQAAMSFNVAVADTTAPANLEGITTAAATAGPTGTGGAAASAATSAAAAASAAGMSNAAIAAAAQAAADATIGGATPSQAAEQGNAAAVSVSISEGNIAAAGATGITPADTGVVGDEGPGTGNDANVGDAPPGGGEAPSVGDTASDGVAAADGVGADGPGVGTGDGVGGGGASAGDGSGPGSGDGGYAKGGFVSKKKKTTAPKSTSLVSRRN